MSDIFIGQIVDGYKILSKVGEGVYGKVYRAYEKELEDTRAVKFIRSEELKDRPEWDNEIRKVLRLKTISNVVNYKNRGSIDISGVSYTWIMWDFIEGNSLKELIDNSFVTISMLIDIVKKTLAVLHACKIEGIQHGDLHSGNILIQKQDTRNINPTYRNVWITDFGYGHASLGSSILDDYRGLNSIIQDCLNSIDFHKLEGEEKIVYTVLKHEFNRCLLENNPTVGDYVREPAGLIKEFDRLRDAKKEIAITNKTNINDYLVAESIGDSFEEWKDLFVPDFLGSEELLGINICVLTGLRGCGKTMIFRRATALYDLVLGKSGVYNEDRFLGFYLNARNIAEAFPWLPKSKKEDAREQIINYFHLCWLIEIVLWLRAYAQRHEGLDFNWFLEFLSAYFKDIIITSDDGKTILDHIFFYLTKRLNRSRLTGGYSPKQTWELSDYRFLDQVFDLLSQNCLCSKGKVYYLFLDDYSTPMVNSTTQEILNPIIFRRSSKVFFKVATESIESFYNIGLNGKTLEEKDDYLLVDFGTLSILRDEKVLERILSSIMEPRINRNSALKGKDLTLHDILGETEYTNIELAYRIRGEDTTKKISYYGFSTFCSVWSSSVREMISIFSDMISSIEIPPNYSKSNQMLIPTEVQDKVFRSTGGGFLNLLSSATPPQDDCYDSNEYERSFGDHLVRIGKAFQIIASYDLKSKTSKNVNSTPPKQARKIEIRNIEPFKDKKLQELYKGIIRYGLFIRDNRGKSVRGNAVPRLYLRGLLIPYFTLTFSKRDSITMGWDDFCSFLDSPEKYTEEYIRRHKDKEASSTEGEGNNTDQMRLEL